MKGNIHSVETFGTVDGPGIRYVIFTQGCNFRCLYCHNPDSWVCGKGDFVDVETLVEDIKKYTRYISGVTVSGGEPLLQIDFVTELFKKVKELGLSTCIDTSGSEFDREDIVMTTKIDELLSVCDLVMLDVKHIDDEKHRYLTGHSNKRVLDFAEYIASKNKDLWLRYVLVPTINDDEDSLKRWKEFADTLKSVKKIDLLPYHRLAINKYEKLGIEYRIRDINEPTKEQIEKAKIMLQIKEN